MGSTWKSDGAESLALGPVQSAKRQALLRQQRDERVDVGETDRVAAATPAASGTGRYGQSQSPLLKHATNGLMSPNPGAPSQFMSAFMMSQSGYCSQ